MASPLDSDPEETREWLDALEGLLEREGPDRAHFLIERLIERARRSGAYLPFSATTAYLNTIPVERQARFPGDFAVEQTIRHYVRWNAMAMVVRANRRTNVGGHIASFASAATLYDVGYNHFWRTWSEERGGDLLYVQGHSAPGIYARAFLLGLLTEEQLDHFRQEVEGKGLSSYPHPWLMPDFWQFSTVSMGLGPLLAVYQARFMRYLQDRGLAHTEGRKVWAFAGDGEMDEPEACAAVGMAGRERLDNLILVVNCNLQRLDGPVRGNGKIIQELEGTLRGAGWNVIKVVWGRHWDPLLARDHGGALARRMMEVVDGEYQTYKSKNGAFVREHFFAGAALRDLVADLSDEDIWHLNRGGHDPFKVYAAYDAAVRHEGQPTAILAKTIKGYGLGEAGEALNTTHQLKKMDLEAIRRFRDRFQLPVPDDRLEELPYLRFEEGSKELEYLRARRQELGGDRPRRRRRGRPLEVPPLSAFARILRGSEGRAISTTMAFVQILQLLLRDEKIGPHVVPIVPDESRTFGMEGMFRQLGIWSHVGQLYDPEDAEQLAFYKEERRGQILQEGITEAGAAADWIAAATSYSVHGVPTVPVLLLYSMFGFQRVGDLLWAGADMRARGFLVGATSGRTTLNGEGLQHQDGHSQVIAAAVPTCVSYDPAFGYEAAVIVQDGLRRMAAEQQELFYYLTVANENHAHPPMPSGAEEGIRRGMYLFRAGAPGARDAPRVQLLGSGAIFREVVAAAELLERDFGVQADLWSCTSFTELARDALAASREALLHPGAPPRPSHLEASLRERPGPVIAATDWVRAYPEQIRPYLSRRCLALGTDGFGRSDTRERLRAFFEVDRRWVAAAAVRALADEGALPMARAEEALERYAIDRSKPPPWTM